MFRSCLLATSQLRFPTLAIATIAIADTACCLLYGPWALVSFSWPLALLAGILLAASLIVFLTLPRPLSLLPFATLLALLPLAARGLRTSTFALPASSSPSLPAPLLSASQAASTFFSVRAPSAASCLAGAPGRFFDPSSPISPSTLHCATTPGLVLAAGLANLLGPWGWPLIFAAAISLLAWSAYRLAGSGSVGIAAIFALPLFTPLLLDAYSLSVWIPALALALSALALVPRWPLLAGLALALSATIDPVSLLLAPSVLLSAAWTSPRHLFACATTSFAASAFIAGFWLLGHPDLVSSLTAFFVASGVQPAPVSGLGFPHFLLVTSLLANRWSSFLSWPFYLIILPPFTFAASHDLRRHHHLSHLLAWSAALAFIVFFFARSFPPEVVGLCAGLAALALVMRSAERSQLSSLPPPVATAATHPRSWFPHLSPALASWSATFLVALTLASLLALRAATGPDASWRAPLAVAPSGSAYTITPDGHLWLLVPGRPRVYLADTLVPAPLDMAVDASTILVAGGSIASLSTDAGHHFHRLQVGPAFHFSLASISGPTLLLASWGEAAWTSPDDGAHWRRLPPLANAGFESALISPAFWLLATQTGAYLSYNQGRTFALVSGLPAQATTVASTAAGLQVGTWTGAVYTPVDLAHWRLAASVPGGVWQIDPQGDIAASSGLYLNGIPVAGTMAGHEASRVLRTGGTIYADFGPQGLLYSSDGGAHWRPA